MTKVQNNNYITVQGWMINDLKLKGTELLVYAVIYGFSQAEGQRYTGSLQYLAEWCGATKRSVQTALKSLTDKGYIQREDKLINGVKFVEYFVGIEKISMGGMEKISTNIIDINNIDNYINNKTPTKKTAKPTLEEVQAYCAERQNKVDPAKFYDYYEANGWVQGKAGKPVKDWRACVRTWERNSFDTGKKVQAVPDYMIADYESPKPSASLDETKEIKAMLEALKNA